MTTIEPHLVAADSAADRADGFFTGLAAWITTTDHKRIGRLYIGFSLLLLVAAGAIAALLGFERIDATADALSSGAMPQLFSLYRVVLTFGVLVPLGLGLAVAVPAVFSYNILLRRNKAIQDSLREFTSDLEAYIIGGVRPETTSARPAPAAKK